MKRLPTDLELLNTIYDMYFDEYASYVEGKSTRRSKNYVPLDIRKIAEKLKTEEDIIFGRLYYVLERRHGYKNERGTDVHFFAHNLGEGEIHSIHFPYMASELAGLRNEHRTAHHNFIAAAVSAIAATISVVVTYWTAGR